MQFLGAIRTGPGRGLNRAAWERLVAESDELHPTTEREGFHPFTKRPVSILVPEGTVFVRLGDIEVGHLIWSEDAPGEIDVIFEAGDPKALTDLAARLAKEVGALFAPPEQLAKKFPGRLNLTSVRGMEMLQHVLTFPAILRCSSREGTWLRHADSAEWLCFALEPETEGSNWDKVEVICADARVYRVKDMRTVLERDGECSRDALEAIVRSAYETVESPETVPHGLSFDALFELSENIPSKDGSKLMGCLALLGVVVFVFVPGAAAAYFALRFLGLLE